MLRKVSFIFLVAVFLGTSLGARPQGGEETEAGTSYGHLRTLEGAATLYDADGEAAEAMVNYPVQTGDSLLTDPQAAVELVLADFSVVRVGPNTEIGFPELAFSADGSARSTRLTLQRGEIQIVVDETVLGDNLPRIETPNSVVFLHEPGVYSIAVDASGNTRVVTRSGYAEASTDRGSAIIRASETALIEGLSRPGIVLAAAGEASWLETWGEQLTRAAAVDPAPGIEPALGYSSSRLQESGEWLEVEGQTAWRPHVEVSWRPYTNGRWVSTYSGLTWVGAETWGWVTGHYGYWSHHLRWGWIWRPGRVYSPAWVYWHWGPEWVGWVPVGYYGGHGWGHGHHRRHFYGYAGGPWHHYRDWTFCPTTRIGHHGGRKQHYGGHEMAKHTGRPAVPRGVIATETSGITPAIWRDGGEVGRILAGRAPKTAASTRPPDLSAFVAGAAEAPAGRSAVARFGAVEHSIDGSGTQAWRSPKVSRSRRVSASPASVASAAPRSRSVATVRPSTAARAPVAEQLPRRSMVRSVTRTPVSTSPRTHSSEIAKQTGSPASARSRQGWRAERIFEGRTSDGGAQLRPPVRPLGRSAEHSRVSSPTSSRSSSGLWRSRGSERPTLYRPPVGSSSRSGSSSDVGVRAPGFSSPHYGRGRAGSSERSSESSVGSGTRRSGPQASASSPRGSRGGSRVSGAAKRSGASSRSGATRSRSTPRKQRPGE